MKKFWIQVILLSLLIFAGFYSYHNPDFILSFIPNNSSLSKTQIKVGSAILNVEIANSASERAKGLSGRDSIASDSGMLFIFDSSKRYQFWMKGMKIPIDMIFINNGKIVDLLKIVPPPLANQKDSDLPRYQPISDIDMVLEVQNGYIDKNSLVVGDNVYLIKQ